jgi:transposase
VSRTKEEILLELERRSKQFEEEKASLLLQIDELKESNESLSALILFLRRQKYKPQNESLTEEQISLFNEAEQDIKHYSESNEMTDKVTDIASCTELKKIKTGRKPLPTNIEREDIIIDLPESDKICVHDGSVLKKVGEETSERLKVIPMQMRVIRTIRYKYACSCCESGNKIAAIPKTLIPHSISTPETLAFVAVSKYEDALPLYRIENILSRNDISISRGTLAHWMIKSAQATRPLINLMRDDLLSSNYLHMDETTVQVLDEQDRKSTSKSYMWVQLSTNDKKKMVLFNYDPSRSGKTAKNLLDGFCGYLQVDGYSGYNFTGEQGTKIHRVSCLAHIRRKFKIIFDDKKLRTPYVLEIINLIRKIYEEHSKMGYDPATESEKVIQYKKKYVFPHLEKLKFLIDTKYGQVPPKTFLGEALGYAHNELPHLLKYYAEVAELQLDNNLVENAIRPFAVGRKNWLFSQSTDGAEASSILYSLVESAKLNNLDPYKYLNLIFKQLPFCENIQDFEKLLPYNVSPKLLTTLN